MSIEIRSACRVACDAPGCAAVCPPDGHDREGGGCEVAPTLLMMTGYGFLRRKAMLPCFMDLNGVELSCSLETWTPELFFNNRMIWYQQVKNSREVFDQLPHDNKEAVLDMVRRSLYLAADEVEAWVPSAFSPESISDTLVIELKLSTSQVDAEIADRKKYTSKRLAEIAEDARSDMEEDQTI